MRLEKKFLGLHFDGLFELLGLLDLHFRCFLRFFELAIFYLVGCDVGADEPAADNELISLP